MQEVSTVNEIEYDNEIYPNSHRFDRSRLSALSNL